MNEMRKITVEVSKDDLDAAQEYTGAGVSETVRAALARLRTDRAQKRALALRGKVKFSMTWQEMKYDRE
jgi:Arc/MetJ-type ribon-helix-helix transcriptional regulator